jgi:hypothetical protein
VADKRCENGHFIDESWDLCPYCPADSGEGEIPIVRPSRFGRQERREPRPGPAPVEDRRATDPEPQRPVVVPPAALTPRRADTVPAPAQGSPPMERTVSAQKIDPGTAQPARHVVGWLVGLSGAGRGESFPLRIGRNVLGRDRRSDIVINDDQASSHHADLVFRPEERRFILMDHNSTNGTYVNEAEIEPRRDLANRDIVRIGSHRFLFVPLCSEDFYWDGEGVLQ